TAQAVPSFHRGQTTSLKRGVNEMLPSHTCFLKCRTSVPHLAVANSEPLVAGQFLQAHRAARADLVSADADLGAHAELAAVGEAGRGVPINRGGIHLAEELPRSRLIPRHDAVGVRRAVMVDVVNRLPDPI